MSFSNTDYIYEHLPSRFRRSDADGLLKRYLTPAGETLDAWDEAFDEFHASITPATASRTWAEFWLLVLFGWSWFPWWFTLIEVRNLYAGFARHIARRGTARGIELWLAAFAITARVHLRPVVWGEAVWGETTFSAAQPLTMIVEVLRIRQPPSDAGFAGEAVWGESFYTVPRRPYTEREIVDLIRWMQPASQSLKLAWRLDDGGEGPIPVSVYWGQISW